jgi:hypothetical protein
MIYLGIWMSLLLSQLRNVAALVTYVNDVTAFNTVFEAEAVVIVIDAVLKI